MKLVSQSRFRLIRMSRLLCLIALAIALDGDGIKFGLGDDGNLSVEVDAENFRLIRVIYRVGTKYWPKKWKIFLRGVSPFRSILDQNSPFSGQKLLCTSSKMTFITEIN